MCDTLELKSSARTPPYFDYHQAATLAAHRERRTSEEISYVQAV